MWSDSKFWFLCWYVKARAVQGWKRYRKFFYKGQHRRARWEGPWQKVIADATAA